MEEVNEKYLRVSGQTQQVSVELYKVLSQHQKLDLFMKDRLLNFASAMYSTASDLLDCSNNIEYLCRLKMMVSEITQINNLMLMCFQLGMLGSDLCIDYGQKLEFIKTDLKLLVELQDQQVKKDFKIDMNDDEIDWDDL
jgi:hypothetical protein